MGPVGDTFRALIAEKTGDSYSTDFRDLAIETLPPGDVLIDVAYSSLNYKDGLAVTGRGKVIRSFPMVCGIDLAGRVLASQSPEFKTGNEVLAVGQGLGETRWGGYSQRARVSAEMLVPLPAGLTLEQAMAIGTAGFTAMLCLMALEQHDVLPSGDVGGDAGRVPRSGPAVIVTGAAGGVGSIAVALLAGRGYQVAASTGRPDTHAYLRDLGAATIVDRADLANKGPALASERWAGAIDTVGGQTLASVIASTASNGAVAACGLAGGADLPTTVFPFILRNVSLLGINSSGAARPLLLRAWDRLAREPLRDTLAAITTLQPLSKIKQLSEDILAGQVRGRVVLDVNA